MTTPRSREIHSLMVILYAIQSPRLKIIHIASTNTIAGQAPINIYLPHLRVIGHLLLLNLPTFKKRMDISIHMGESCGTRNVGTRSGTIKDKALFGGLATFWVTFQYIIVLSIHTCLFQNTRASERIF